MILSVQGEQTSTSLRMDTARRCSVDTKSPCVKRSAAVRQGIRAVGSVGVVLIPVVPKTLAEMYQEEVYLLLKV